MAVREHTAVEAFMLKAAESLDDGLPEHAQVYALLAIAQALRDKDETESQGIER